MQIKAQDGSDGGKTIVAKMKERKSEMTKEYIDLWFQESTDWLSDAAQRRSELGVSHGREGRAQHGLDQIRKGAIPPYWDDRREAWVFGFPHIGAIFQEFGAIPHEIRAKKAEALAFEWPDAPEDVKEDFEYTEGDLVFFESVNHPGIPAIGFTRYGRDKAELYLEKQGHSTEVFK